jgi:hypothetical protein
MNDLFGDERLPVISLWQPWASLIFSGHKRCETRGFAPPFKYVGKRIAVHAAKRSFGREGYKLEEPLWWLCRRALGDHFAEPGELPYGAILGTVTLGGFLPTEKAGFIPEDERIAGDWSDGRYAWQLLDPVALDKPIPAKGKQGWWSIDATDLGASHINSLRERGEG